MEIRSTRICPACNCETRTRDELHLVRHQWKKGGDCPGSGGPVEGLPYGPRYGPEFQVDEATGLSRHQRAECDICGAAIAIETASRVRYSHLDPGKGVRCRGSGRGASGHDRDSLTRPKKACPACGRIVSVGGRYGRYYSHNDPSTGRLCDMSGEQGGEIIVERIEIMPPPSSRAEQYRAIDTTRDTTSIRTVSGGIPGSRRRH